MKFKYLDPVKVKEGFFNGVTGQVVDYMYTSSFPCNLILKYKIPLNNGDRWFKEDELELIEGATAGASG